MAVHNFAVPCTIYRIKPANSRLINIRWTQNKAKKPKHWVERAAHELSIVLAEQIKVLKSVKA